VEVVVFPVPVEVAVVVVADVLCVVVPPWPEPVVPVALPPAPPVA
jgi:hypothetical protein